MSKPTLSPIVVDTSRSPHVRLRPVPLTAVALADSFWAPRRRINREATLPSQYRLLEETGRLDNFRRAAGKKSGSFQGYFFNDSDVYKWLEAIAWTLATDSAPALAQMADAAITEVADAQGPDGYLNTHFTFERAAERWTNLRDLHELYCAGHLIQAGVAYQRATGSGRLLGIARRLADHICDVFGPTETGKRPGTCGHPEIEMALVELARATGDRKYRAQAQYFLDARGHGLIGGSPYHQDHKPFREFDRMVGHAVRAVYLNAGATDLYAETGEAALRTALDRMWRNMTERQMYVSGGVGSRHEGEAFGADYELPNARAYTETCAAIGVVMWAWRMLALEGDARYADVLEMVLYNGVLSGLSLDGLAYFYVNPLADDGARLESAEGKHRRQPWFDCACCPPNIARLLASLPGYFYSVSDGGIWVHLYAGGSARVTLLDGRIIGLSQYTRYPWDGEVAIGVAGEGTFSLWLRVPGWCEEGGVLEVNGRPVEAALTPGAYVEIRRDWQPGDIVRLSLPMPARRVESHPYVAENRGRVALMRGPLLYCVEGACPERSRRACPDGSTSSPRQLAERADLSGVAPRDLCLSADAEVSAEFRPDLLGGVAVLRFLAEVVPPDAGWAGRLYRTVRPEPGREAARPTCSVTAIPYYAWANRTPGPMQVWLTGR